MQLLWLLATNYQGASGLEITFSLNSLENRTWFPNLGWMRKQSVRLSKRCLTVSLKRDITCPRIVLAELWQDGRQCVVPETPRSRGAGAGHLRYIKDTSEMEDSICLDKSWTGSTKCADTIGSQSSKFWINKFILAPPPFLLPLALLLVAK
jgi:hypothetical protein